ncbi:LCP family protein [Candidatus Daviesbacteria bacterium]|nr:LCP family protein [Candidatus Daviesbacteria bacterium]
MIQKLFRRKKGNPESKKGIFNVLERKGTHSHLKSKKTHIRIKFHPQKSPATKLAFLALGLILGVLILGKIVNFFEGLSKPFSQDILTKRSYVWDGSFAISIAFKGSSIWVLNYDPEEKKAIVLKIPEETYMDLPRGYGSWRVGSIYQLGQEEIKSIGSELLKESLAKLLGLPIDGFITLDQASNQDLDKIILSLRSNPLALINFIRNIRTDLTPLETVSLLRELAKVRSDKLVALNLEESNITKSKLLPDSSRVLGVDTVNLDLFIRDKMSDQKISQENLEVAIFNATTHPGLALDVARVVTNLGSNAIIVSNSEDILQKSIVTSENNRNSLTFKRLSQIFAPDCFKKPCQASDPKIKNSRAQINIVLGEDYYNANYQR